MGDQRVGKTRLLNSHPGSRSLCTSPILNQFELILRIKEKKYKLLFEDLNGNTDFECLRTTFIYPKTDIFLVLYSITNEESYKNVSDIVK